MPLLAFNPPTPSPSVPPTQTNVSIQPPPSTSAPPIESEPPQTTKYPIVTLDTPTIADLTASKLASSFLGHILFLKSQIPLPIPQLARMSGQKSTPRATKHRTELLSSYDTLSSHLGSTFTALSTALARCSFHSSHTKAKDKTSRAYMAFVLGGSVTAPKARVFFAVEGLEVKVWGVREDAVQQGNDEDDEDEDDEEEEEEEDDECSDEEEEDDEEDLSDDKPPSSSEEDDEDEEDEVELPPQTQPTPHDLHLADRLLSRTLASFSSLDTNPVDFAAELPLLQTHVLLRAPRRFSHPAWVPKQNVSSGMEGALAEFLSSSSASPKEEKKKWGKVKPEGVWIVPTSGSTHQEEEEEEEGGEEEDEMIWWAWEGKVVGFNDW